MLGVVSGHQALERFNPVLINASRFSDKVPLGSGTLSCTNAQFPNRTAGEAPSVTGVQEYPYPCWEG